MTTITVTKKNYSSVINKINDMLFSEKKLIVSIDNFERVQDLYDNAKNEYRRGETIYWWEIIINGN